MAPPTPLECPRQVEHQRIGREPADERGDREDPEPDGEDLPPPEHVADHSGGEEEGSEGEGVGVDYPLEVAEGRVQGPLYVGEGDVDNRYVQQEHEDGGADGDQGPPFTVHGNSLGQTGGTDGAHSDARRIVLK